jgi:hypothetical protein
MPRPNISPPICREFSTSASSHNRRCSWRSAKHYLPTSRYAVRRRIPCANSFLPAPRLVASARAADQAASSAAATEACLCGTLAAGHPRHGHPAESPPSHRGGAQADVYRGIGQRVAGADE